MSLVERTIHACMNKKSLTLYILLQSCVYRKYRCKTPRCNYHITMEAHYDHLVAAFPYGSPFSLPRSRVPEEDAKTNCFSHFLAQIIQIKSCTKTRQHGYKLLN